MSHEEVKSFWCEAINAKKEGELIVIVKISFEF